jgi:hypothetical protein
MTFSRIMTLDSEYYWNLYENYIKNEKYLALW